MKLSPVLFFFYLTKISSEIGILHLEDTILRTQTQEKTGDYIGKTEEIPQSRIQHVTLYRTIGDNFGLYPRVQSLQNF